MFRLLLAIPLSLFGAALGAVLAALAAESPRGLISLVRWGVPRLVRPEAWRNGWMISISQPGSLAAVVARVLARAAGAFGTARLVLLVFGLGAVKGVAVTIGLILILWDLYWLWFLARASFPAPKLTLQLHRTQLVVGMIVSVVGILLFIRT